MDLDYDFLGIKNLKRIWTMCDSENGNIVLVGGSSGDKTHIIQVDVEKKEVAESYWLPGKYPICSIIINNAMAAIGTNDGHIILINLEENSIEKINKISLKSESIKSIAFSNEKGLLFVAGTKNIFSVDASNLEVLDTHSIKFNPWDILLIPRSGILAIAGSKISLELFNYKNGFCKLDSICYGSENRDMTSLALYEEFLVSASEKGLIYFWKVTDGKLNVPMEVSLESSMVYELQSTSKYVAFSNSKNGAGFIDFKEKAINNIPCSRKEGNICLKKIKESVYILYFSLDGEIGIANITDGNLGECYIKNLPDGIRHAKLTSNGAIVAASSEGIIISSLENSTADDSGKIFSDSFSINRSNNYILLHDKSFNTRLANIDTKKIMDMDYLEHGTWWSHGDFLDDIIIRVSHEEIECSIKNLIHKFKLPSTIGVGDIRIINNTKFVAYVNEPEEYKSYLFYFNDKCEQIDSLDIGSNPHGHQFINNEYLCVSYISSPFNNDSSNSKLINLASKSVREFETGYTFDKNNSAFTNDANYCFTLRYDELVCSDISAVNEKTIWRVEDPLLSDYTMLGYNFLLSSVLIVDMVSGHLLSISDKNGDIIDSFQLPSSIDDIKMGGECKYLIWKSKKGNISYSSFPFEDILLDD